MESARRVNLKVAGKHLWEKSFGFGVERVRVPGKNHARSGKLLMIGPGFFEFQLPVSFWHSSQTETVLDAFHVERAMPKPEMRST